MKLRTKIFLLFTLGAIVPLVLSHLFARQMVTSSMKELIEEDLAHTAEQGAGRISDWIERLLIELTMVVDAVPFESFPAEDLHRALEIPYRQLPGATIVALLDESGRAVVLPFWRSGAEATKLDREGVEEQDLDLFAANVPHQLALSAQVAVGPVYLSSSGKPRMAVARSFVPGEGVPPWVLAVEISLAEVCQRVDEHRRSAARRAVVIDLKGRPICSGSAPRAGEIEPLALAEQVLQASEGKAFGYDVPGEGRVLAVVSGVGVTGWRLLLEQSEELAMAPASRLDSWIVIWLVVGLGIALLGGAILARGLTQPIADLESAAVRVAAGDYEKSLEVRSADELGSLAGSFNKMIQEIRTWNAELISRVEERTRELREAQEQIMQSQKLAAVGELGSGVAHEINNPLTGVIGTAQLLLSEAEQGSEMADSLSDIISSARRVAEVVDALLRLSQAQAIDEMQTLVVSDVIESVLALFITRLEERQIKVETRLDEQCRVNAVETDLRLVVNNLVDNSLRVMENGGTLEIDVSLVQGGAVLLSISDTGPGMDEDTRARVFDPFYTTAPPGSGKRGLGLSLVHRVVAEHQGRIVLDSEPGQGTQIKIYLPGVVRLSRQ